MNRAHVSNDVRIAHTAWQLCVNACAVVTCRRGVADVNLGAAFTCVRYSRMFAHANTQTPPPPRSTRARSTHYSSSVRRECVRVCVCVSDDAIFVSLGIFFSAWQRRRRRMGGCEQLAADADDAVNTVPMDLCVMAVCVYVLSFSPSRSLCGAPR